MCRHRFHQLAAAFIMVAAAAGCSDNVTVDHVQMLPRVIIFDQDGRRWDITQAVYLYGFERSKFQFGFGAFATQPLVLPPMVAMSDSGFPPVDSTFTVAAVSLGGDRRAYGTVQLAGFELINDTTGSGPFAIVYQPLLGTTRGYRRLADTDTLTLSASGWTYEDQNILFDYETWSLWYRFSGSAVLTCINGSHLTEELPSIPATTIAWSLWVAMNPSTRVLRLPPVAPSPTNGK